MFLIFVGGMIISFIYVTALAHNIKFYLKSFFPAFYFFRGTAIFFMCRLQSLYPSFALKQIYEPIFSYSIILMITFLLVALLNVVKFGQNYKGALLKPL